MERAKPYGTPSVARLHRPALSRVRCRFGIPGTPQVHSRASQQPGRKHAVRKTMTLTLGLFAILATACTSGGASPSAAGPTIGPTASTAAATTAPSVAPSASADACAAATLPVLTAGKLTIGTDNPAYPSYFAENAD